MALLGYPREHMVPGAPLIRGFRMSGIPDHSVEYDPSQTAPVSPINVEL
jgi:hypothetical protein